ncbi:MAG TPA: sigma-70 family RNA polymerase sigma factor [Kofleriaceae bacterium]|nr:sigma-70 family RNA polymerase sigma factor [Kofleriaceae bacterium]
MNALAIGRASAGTTPPAGGALYREDAMATADVDLRGELAALHDAAFAWAMCCCRFVRADAEDALHVAYVKVLDGRATFSGRSAFRTWLFGVIRRTAGEVRRRELARRLLGGRRDDAAVPRPDELVDAERERARVRSVLCALSTRQREVLELVIHQALTLDEAAAVLGLSPGTARKHYERGKRALRRALGGEHD